MYSSSDSMPNGKDNLPVWHFSACPEAKGGLEESPFRIFEREAEFCSARDRRIRRRNVCRTSEIINSFQMREKDTKSSMINKLFGIVCV